jgi:hypothetical protein
MSKVYKIMLEGKFWTLKDTVVPTWTDTGDFFTANQIDRLLTRFKYQRKLWPTGAKVISYTISDETETDLAQEIFDQLDKEITFESLQGSAY